MMIKWINVSYWRQIFVELLKLRYLTGETITFPLKWQNNIQNQGKAAVDTVNKMSDHIFAKTLVEKK